MSVARVKLIFETIAGRNITNQQMRDVVVGFLETSAMYDDLDTADNETLAGYFLIELRNVIKKQASQGTSNKWQKDNATARLEAVEQVAANLDE